VYRYDWLVVGAGFAGSVLAERLASQRGDRVLLVDRRPHRGGNAHDRLDAAGILVHQYGPHIFHTNSAAIVEYLSQFTDWRPYEHRVLAQVDGQLLPIPINLDTINRLYGLDLDGPAMEAFLAARREPVAEVRTAEDVVLSTVGRDLYEKFFRGYTTKQWGMDPSQLSKSVTARIPTRTNRDDRYFTDTFQKMPARGYTAMFERMVDHPNIDVLLSTDYAEIKSEAAWRRTIFTGPIDEFFGHRLGRLPYRSLSFRHVTVEREWHQPVAVVNYPGSEPFTRVTEYKHLTGQRHRWTSLTYEYPSDQGDPYYPVPRPENEALYKRYEMLARRCRDIWFAGRLATYRYYNMDQVVGQALATFARIDEGLSGVSRRGRPAALPNEVVRRGAAAAVQATADGVPAMRVGSSADSSAARGAYTGRRPPSST
jgi:UDP-galactopyranose mutase